MPFLKSEAPAEIVELLARAEAQADGCWRGVDLRYYPADLSIWALLTGGVRLVEGEQAARGSDTSHFDAMLGNLSRLLTTAFKWGVQRCGPAADSSRRWTGELSVAVDRALALARAYSHFEVCFQGFHISRYAVDVISPSLLRFSVPEGDRDRQVSAYQKGLRPVEGPFAGQRIERQPQEPRTVDAFVRAVGACRPAGSLGFEYDDPWDLWREMVPEYRERITALSRRTDTLSLGAYTLSEYDSFYVSLLVICAAHEHLCFLWTQAHDVFPIESAVLVRSAAKWVDVLSILSGLPPEKCRAMIADLTFSTQDAVDLHVFPFVSLGGSDGTLALAPPFPLHSRHDENILRVCSQRRPRVYDITSLEKQAEMLATVQTKCSRYRPTGNLRLPNPAPDIDLLVVDESCSTIVIAELKWIRKPVRPAEIPDRDADVLKGIRQLKSIRAFFANSGDYLRARGCLPRRVDQFDQVHYLLVARDHWRWVEPSDAVAIVEFDPFVRTLERSASLRSAIDELLACEWLPVEGRDFRVQYDEAEANGVTIESPVFYSTAPA